MHRMQCGEIWGGIRGRDLDVESAGVRASLFSSAVGGDRGGDIYYFSVCDNDLLTRVLVADVTGHGEAVAKTSAWIYDSLKQAMNDPDGSRVLGQTNKLASSHGIEAITTAAIAAFYRTESALSFAYAGHHPVLVRRPGELEWQALTVPESPRIANLPLGVVDDAAYDQATTSLPDGSIAVIYTDGILEARNAEGEAFGSERFVAALSTVRENDPVAIKEAVLSRLLQHAENAPGQDDLTLIAFSVSASAAVD